MTEEKQDFIIHPAHLRIAVIMFAAFLIFSVIAIQLWNVQINNNAEYNDKITRQSVRMIRQPAVRGRIFASDGRTAIAANRVSYRILLRLSEMRLARRDRTIQHIMNEAERISRCIGRSNPLTPDKISRHMNLFPGIPMELFEDLTDRELGRASELLPEVTGMEITAEPVRTYPFHSLAAHLIGYVGPGDPQRALDRTDFFYYIPDPSGRTGIEKLYDEMLRGSPGKELVLVNSRGFVHEVVGTPVAAQNGHDIVLTLDLRAQQIAESLIAGKEAAMIVMDASTGAVLAMASAPAYDLEDFIPGISREKYKALLDNPGKPFLNKAVMGAYMPGSIIKPLAALAFLENGLSLSDTVDCNGWTEVSGIRIRCAARYGHGPLSIEEAIQRSCNDFFIENALEIGIDKLSAMYASAGIGRKTGFELSERSGLLPKGEPGWTRTETAFVGIGQGRVEVTPLQAITYISAIANGGKLYRPYIIDRVLDGSGNVLFRTRPEVTGNLAASRNSLDIVSAGMYLAVNAPRGGSAAAAKNSKIELHGKTGTAEVGPLNARYKNTWFTAFGVEPESQKIYSIIILVGHGRSGGGTCAPLAREFFERWLTKPQT